MERFQVRDLMSGLQSDHERGESPGARLCRACVELIGVSGAGIMIMDDEGHGTSLGVSDDASGAIEDLQFMLGEGPGIDAHTLGRPVLGPSLDDLDRAQWPTFAPEAVRGGPRGV